MPKNLPARRTDSIAGQVLETEEQSILDLLDHVLNKGVVASGDVTMGVAGIDLIYLRLSALLCAADRVIPRDQVRKRHRHPKAGVRRSRSR